MFRSSPISPRNYRFAIATAVLFLALASVHGAAAHSYKLGQLSIGHLWSKPTEAADETAAVFGPVLNGGSETVTLSRVASPVAERAGICTSSDGATEWLETVTIEPAAALALAPWREHICLAGLEKPLEKGQSIPLELGFEAAGTIDVEVVVETAAGH